MYEDKERAKLRSRGNNESAKPEKGGRGAIEYGRGGPRRPYFLVP